MQGSERSGETLRLQIRVNHCGVNGHVPHCSAPVAQSRTQGTVSHTLILPGREGCSKYRPRAPSHNHLQPWPLPCSRHLYSRPYTLTTPQQFHGLRQCSAGESGEEVKGGVMRAKAEVRSVWVRTMSRWRNARTARV